MTESIFSYPLKESAEPLKNSSSRLKKKKFCWEMSSVRELDEKDRSRQKNMSVLRVVEIITNSLVEIITNSDQIHSQTCLLPEERALNFEGGTGLFSWNMLVHFFLQLRISSIWVKNQRGPRDFKNKNRRNALRFTKEEGGIRDIAHS